VIYVKTYWTPNGVMVAACDLELLGKQFAEGELRLKVSEKFYKGEKVAVEALIPYLKSCMTANLVGEAVIACAKAAGFIDEDGVIRIDGVPHAQLYRI
jgi:hypothetical protein